MNEYVVNMALALFNPNCSNSPAFKKIAINRDTYNSIIMSIIKNKSDNTYKKIIFSVLGKNEFLANYFGSIYDDNIFLHPLSSMCALMYLKKGQPSILRIGKDTLYKIIVSERRTNRHIFSQEKNKIIQVAEKSKKDIEEKDAEKTDFFILYKNDKSNEYKSLPEEQKICTITQDEIRKNSDLIKAVEDSLSAESIPLVASSNFNKLYFIVTFIVTSKTGNPIFGVGCVEYYREGRKVLSPCAFLHASLDEIRENIKYKKPIKTFIYEKYMNLFG